jgi:hypothetical protein
MTTSPHPPLTQTTPLSTFNFVLRPVPFSFSLSSPTSSTTPFTAPTVRLPVNCLPNSPTSSFLRVAVYPHPNRYQPYNPPPLFINHSPRIPTLNFQGFVSGNTNTKIHNNNNNNNNNNNVNNINMNFIPLQSPQLPSLQKRVSSPIKASYFPSIRIAKKQKHKTQTPQKKRTANKRTHIALSNQAMETKRKEGSSTFLAPSSLSTNFSKSSSDNIPNTLHTDNIALAEQIVNIIMNGSHFSFVIAFSSFVICSFRSSGLLLHSKKTDLSYKVVV